MFRVTSVVCSVQSSMLLKLTLFTAALAWYLPKWDELCRWDVLRHTMPRHAEPLFFTFFLRPEPGGHFLVS